MYSELVVLLTTVIYLSLDSYYFLWVLQVKKKLPVEIEKYISKALFGFSKSMKASLMLNLSHLKAQNSKLPSIKPALGKFFSRKAKT